MRRSTMLIVAQSALFTLLAIAGGVVVGQGSAPRTAEASSMPGAPRLLPEETFLYLRIEDVPQLRADLQESSVGRMMNDPKLRPLASDVYVTLSELFAEVGSQFDITLDQLVEIPQGQFAIAVVATDEGSNAPQPEPATNQPKDESPDAIRKRLQERRDARTPFQPGLVIVMDSGERNKTLDKILEQIETRIGQSGAVERSETIGDTTVKRWLTANGERTRMEYFQRDGATVIGFGGNLAADALARWDDKSSSRSLAESTDFAAVMTRCIGAEATRPQITLFADPYRLLRRAVTQSGNIGAALGWQVAEELGIAKIRGMGASTFYGGETFSDIAHGHILIDPPRDGIFSVLRPKDGDTNPPAWVPDDVTSYVSIGWRFDATYDGLGRILDRFQGEGALERLVEQRYQERVGGDFRKSIIEAADDRIVMIRWLQPPVMVNSSVSINAIKLKDPAAAAATIAELRKAFPNAVREEAIGVRPLYLFGRARTEPFPQGLRQPTPCAIIVDNWLLTSDSREFVERAIRANDGVLPKLAALPDYDVLASELGSELEGEKPFLLSFVRSAEVLRQVYELARSDQARTFLDSRSEGNRAARSVGDLLKRNELPPFDEFQKYFAPTGGFAYDEPNGIHFGRFTLKPDQP